MLGINYIKFDAMAYVIHFKNGKLKKEGKGLSFFYSSMNSSIVAIPLGSNDIQFIFKETTADFQSVTVQGQITYKIENPKQLTEILDFTVDSKANLKTNDIEKLKQRLINQAQTEATSYIQSITLKEAIKNAKAIETKISEGLKSSNVSGTLGVSIMSVNVIAVKPNPDMAKALETTTREALQQEADIAIYERRNFAVEQERKIKESEFNTEIAVEEKQKQISEKKMERQVVEQDNRRKLVEMQTEADIAVEEKKKKLILAKVENIKKQADADKYALEAKLEPYKKIDWKILSAISGNGSAKNDIAIAFRELAENAKSINNLNITPDLLQSLTE